MTMMLLAAAWIAGNYVPPAEDDYRAFFEDAPAPVLRRTFELKDAAFAIYHKMLPSADLDAAYGILRYDVIAHDNALSTGIFATQYLLEILTERGDAELAGKVAMHEGFPGWFNMLDHGATTLWESWIGSDNIYSHCHPMFGTVAAWMMKGVLGIKVCEDAIGCDKVQIEPHAVPGVTSASGWLDTPKGRITVSWKIVDGKMSVEKSVPVGIKVR